MAAPPPTTMLTSPQWYTHDQSDQPDQASDSSGASSDDGELFDTPQPHPEPFPTSSGPDFAPEPPLLPGKDQPNIHINVKIEDWHTKINCSAGNQSLKWLCLTAVERYRLSRTMNGKVRARENNSPLRRRRPDEDSTFNPLRGLRGSHVPMDIKLKKSFKKIGHHMISLKFAKKKKQQATAKFFQHATNVTAASARRATELQAQADLAVLNRNFHQDTTKPVLGLHECYGLKKRGRGSDGNRMPNAFEPLRYHLKHDDTITLLLDEVGGKYVARNKACSVSSFMRLRFVEPRKHVGLTEVKVVNEHKEKGQERHVPTYVTKRGVADRNSTTQVDENIARLSLFKFIKNKEEHASMKQLFVDQEVYDLLRRLFRNYAYGNVGDAFSMDSGEWESLCKDAGLLNVDNMTYGKIDTVFIAANYTAKALNKEIRTKALKKGGRIPKSNNPDNAFTLHEFFEGICRLGIAMYEENKALSNTEKVQRLLEYYLVPLARSVTGDWDLFQDIESKVVQVEYHNRMPELEAKFRAFCVRKKKNIKKMYLKLDQFVALVESTGVLTSCDVLVNASATHRMVRESFVWSQRKDTQDHHTVNKEEESLILMSFNEFLESLALLGHRIFCSHPDFTHATGSHAEDLAVQLRAFLNVLLVERRELVGVGKK